MYRVMSYKDDQLVSLARHEGERNDMRTYKAHLDNQLRKDKGLVPGPMLELLVEDLAKSLSTVC